MPVLDVIFAGKLHLPEVSTGPVPPGPGQPPGIWGGAPPQVGYPLPQPPPLGIWGGAPPQVGYPLPVPPPPGYPDNSLPPFPAHPIQPVPPGSPGGGTPEHPIVLPPVGAAPPGEPAHPIELPPAGGGGGGGYLILWVPGIGYVAVPLPPGVQLPEPPAQPKA